MIFTEGKHIDIETSSTESKTFDKINKKYMSIDSDISNK